MLSACAKENLETRKIIAVREIYSSYSIESYKGVKLISHTEHVHYLIFSLNTSNRMKSVG
jgi:hypothetical protein